VNDILDVFLQNILPIFIVASIGFVLRRRLGLDKQALSKLTFYAFSPALVFSSLVNSQIPGDEMVQLAAYALAVTLLMGVVALLASRLLRLSRLDTMALLLVVMFVNGGNYGLTLNRLRYGEEGLARAVVFFVVSTILVYTIGVLIASMGKASWRASLARLIRLPAFYAVVLAITVYSLDINLPRPLLRGIEVAGTGAIPVMLVVLGMQIADLTDIGRVWLAAPATVLRLMVAPILAVILAGSFGLDGLNRSTSVIEASMPTAVVTTILAVEFGVRPGLVTSAVVLSTILSALTLPVVITWSAL
jgi:predicted permease